MKLTNKYSLPESFVMALTADQYEKVGDYSVTELLQPPRQRELKARHKDELTEDVSDRIWALLGSSVHNILDKATGADGLNEERLVVDIDGHKISGKPDLLQDNTLTDYKVTSVWKYVFGISPEWEQQLNIYKYLYEQYGFRVDNLQIIAIFRDWKKSDADYKSDYPPVAAHAFQIPVWDNNDIYKFIRERVSLHECVKELHADDLPYCTDEEVWRRSDKWAVKKGDNKKAVKLFDDEDSAEQFIDNDNRNDLWIEFRQGKAVRCEDYCPVKEFCNQYKEESEA